jgi:outer membrane protein, heavy metal efflux system
MFRSEPPSSPTLTSDSSLEDFLGHALRNHPRIRAAYFTWVKNVESITVARSRPDPRLTFEADIARMLETLMFGLMIDLPGPGKLAAAGEAAANESRSSYHAFEREILDVAVAVKTAYFRLHFLAENLRLQREMVVLLEDLEQLAQSQNAAGRVTLQDVLRAQIEKEQLLTQIENLEDSRAPLLAELAAALGWGVAVPEPPVPMRFQASPDAGPPDDLLHVALGANPSLRAMTADVQRAESLLRLANTAGVPDVSLGLEADVKASPVMLRPSAGVTLPIWRDKIAAGIAAAQAEKDAARARLDAERIDLAADLAAMLYSYRESLRDIQLLAERLVPKARQSLAAARPAYSTGRASFLDVIDAQRQLLSFEVNLIDARTRRELALAAISAAVGRFPVGAPVLEARDDEPNPAAIPR